MQFYYDSVRSTSGFGDIDLSILLYRLVDILRLCICSDVGADPCVCPMSERHISADLACGGTPYQRWADTWVAPLQTADCSLQNLQRNLMSCWAFSPFIYALNWVWTGDRHRSCIVFIWINFREGQLAESVPWLTFLFFCCFNLQICAVACSCSKEEGGADICNLKVSHYCEE